MEGHAGYRGTVFVNAARGKCPEWGVCFFIAREKHFYTDLINLLVKDDTEKFHVFDSRGKIRQR